MTEIICLANSWRPDGRCVAGIEVGTGQWVRPVSKPGAGIPKEKVWIGRTELALLDKVEIPLLLSKLQDRYQRENRFLNLGRWRRTGRATVQDVLKYCEDDKVILHNHLDRVDAAVLDYKHPDEWKSLQLVHARNVKFEPDDRKEKEWRCRFMDGMYHTLSLKLRDPVAEHKLNNGEKIASECLLTVSMTGPWQPDPGVPEQCYKLVVGVIIL